MIDRLENLASVLNQFMHLLRSPEIHSGDEHFVIERYIRPRGIDVRPLEEGETLFILPFNHSSLDVEEAYSRIFNRLSDLDLHTLLFLNYIDEIAWEVDGSHSGIYLRETHRESMNSIDG